MKLSIGLKRYMEFLPDIYNTEYLVNSALEKRENLFKDENTNCFRIFNSSGDGFEGLTIDFYAGYILIQYFNKSAESVVNRISQLLIKILPVPIKGILSKNRTINSDKSVEQWKSRGELCSPVQNHTSEPACSPDAKNGVVVIQNGINAKVDLINGQNTGIFLDMRNIRDKLSSFYKSESIKRMLNLFSYTAIFSVHALKNRVNNSINIDLSKTVLNRAKINYHLNDLRVDERDFIYGDAIDWIKRLCKRKELFDFIVFDPPTFARNKKGSFSVKKNYLDSLESIKSLVKDGFILTSVNSYSVTEEEYRSLHPVQWKLLMLENESSDFIYKDNPYLKVGLWKI
ncbi:MAG: class I SAM-dependent methyltransferase [Leptospirales bacterium]|nr:class I SAM-dependent methyltransferase [Leptospirales bacterium]